jgi:hypothetical protein
MRNALQEHQFDRCRVDTVLVRLALWFLWPHCPNGLVVTFWERRSGQTRSTIPKSAGVV